jgi:hypothetical protein
MGYLVGGLLRYSFCGLEFQLINGSVAIMQWFSMDLLYPLQFN